MYNIGDKFVIEIGSIFTDEKGNTLYGIKGFNSLVFDQYGLDRMPCRPKRDMELLDFCHSHKCDSCVMSNVFPQCGNGWHVSKATGKDHVVAHMLMNAVKAKEG